MHSTLRYGSIRRCPKGENTTGLQLHKIDIFGSCFTILAAAEKAVRRGVKEVVKAVNKESKGYVRSPGIVIF